MHLDTNRAWDGYVLFLTQGGPGAFLINKGGELVHSWRLPSPLRAYQGELTANGTLLVGCTTGKEGWLLGGNAGRIIELDWQGDVVWSYEDASLHHDHCRLKNGNTIVMGRRVIAPDIAGRVKGGVPGSGLADGTMICDFLREVTPARRAVWEWHAEDAMVPELDSICPLESRVEWSHCNTVKQIAGSQLLVSFRNPSTVGIIDPATGQFTWRMKPGLTSHQHDPALLENGNVLIFDNGEHRQDGPPRSRVIEVEPGSQNVVWEYKGDPEDSFFSSRIGGVQRLPNGNTLVTEGRSGRMFEVTADCEIVWEYLNPYGAPHLRASQAWSVFRARHYALDDPRIGDLS